MSNTTVFLVGVGIGLVTARLLMAPGNCCDRVAMGVRDKVGETLGGGAQSVGDSLGLWTFTPGLLNVFGVT